MTGVDTRVIMLDGEQVVVDLNGFIDRMTPTVRACIHKHVPRKLGDPEDLTQEIWRQFIEGKHGRSYWVIYDPTKSSPKTFMWEFTRLRCLQFLSRTQRTPTAYAYSIQNQEGEEFQVGIVDPETTPELGVDDAGRIEFADLVARATTAVHAAPKRGRRDLPWVWYLLQRGYRQDEIAAFMELSEGTISICMERIREIPAVQELRSWASDSGLLVN